MNADHLRRYSNLEALEHKIQAVEDLVTEHPFMVQDMSEFNQSMQKYRLIIEDARTILKRGDCDLTDYYIRITKISNEIRVMVGLYEEEIT